MDIKPHPPQPPELPPGFNYGNGYGSNDPVSCTTCHEPLVYLRMGDWYHQNRSLDPVGTWNDLPVPERRTEARKTVAPRRFRLQRNKDISGMSGTGLVAWGVQFPNGITVLSWNSIRSSTNIYNSIDDVIYLHGHEGATVVEWLDEAHYPTATERPSTDGDPTAEA